MDSTALIAAIFGSAFGAGISYWVVKHQKWKAIGLLALGGAALLNIVTQGKQSHWEHIAVFDTTIVLMACFWIAVVADRRARRKG
jgi:peptidoglycan/LPS O-acetylase OafA/YrhL